MIDSRPQVWKERGFLLVLGLLCALITVLQFKWTGELAKAEFERMGHNQHEGAESFAEAFDRELAAACHVLTPQPNELEAKAVVKSMTVRAKRWRATSPKPLFSRIAAAVPNNGVLDLYGVDPAKATVKKTDWPEEWTELKEGLLDRLEGHGGPPYAGPDGLLFEIPIHGKPGRTKEPGFPMEAGWLILEMDGAYLRNVFFPELLEAFLDPGVKDLYQVTVTCADGRVLFSEGKQRDAAKGVAVVEFNFLGRVRKGPGGPPAEAMWRLEVKRMNGELEEIVASSRKRNLVLACAVNGLILLAGFALVRHTRKSRLLAEAQMDFVANVSHELRTPVTVILGAAHNLKRGIVRTPEAVERYAGMIVQHADQLAEMLQEVLEFSAAKKGKTAYPRTPLDLGEVVSQAVEDSRDEMKGMDVDISIREAMPKFSGDAAALRRAFGNLIRNAAKHGGEGGWIGVTAEYDRDRGIVVKVGDRGPGVPKEEQESIFKPFFRGERARGAQLRGSGIGLGLVREIIRAHDGEVSVCSEPGAGATFTVVLPVAATKPDHAREHPVD